MRRLVGSAGRLLRAVPLASGSLPGQQGQCPAPGGQAWGSAERALRAGAGHWEPRELSIQVTSCSPVLAATRAHGPAAEWRRSVSLLLARPRAGSPVWPGLLARSLAWQPVLGAVTQEPSWPLVRRWGASVVFRTLIRHGRRQALGEPLGAPWVWVLSIFLLPGLRALATRSGGRTEGALCPAHLSSETKGAAAPLRERGVGHGETG